MHDTVERYAKFTYYLIYSYKSLCKQPSKKSLLRTRHPHKIITQLFHGILRLRYTLYIST
ncbi:hypothetical protein [Ehrlichia ruminantium]|uniref:hypothetical protein n=1 Tax=Ehrlichia ruminantium TaxID=779 RepID=UPI000A8E3DAE|nr:hypothetical protein [Ehrlichia ruminantium]QLK56261.1 hypothetical protein FDZ61_03735 [Ehrlichia ruminantium]UOD99467.1 hypothetical protein IMW62_03710 [Ehrlichia ruminantium]